MSPAEEPKRRLFTVAEYYKMADAGILTEDARVELIEGDVMQLPPIGNRHAGGVNRLNELLVRAVGERAVVAVQNPLRLNEGSEPQPDLAVLQRRKDFYSGSHPGPGDVHLIIEVSDSTANYDRQVKALL
jgi:Uma2 family endonuclease